MLNSGYSAPSGTLPHIFASGMPACGKSHLGDWLAKNHGYRHIDFEKMLAALGTKYPFEMAALGSGSPGPLIQQLKAEGPLYFNWGFPPDRCLALASKIASELLPVWFWADLKIARTSFTSRKPPIPVELFDKQAGLISQYSGALDTIFGANKINTISGLGTRMPPEEIFAVILEQHSQQGSATSHLP